VGGYNINTANGRDRVKNDCKGPFVASMKERDGKQRIIMKTMSVCRWKCDKRKRDQ